MKLFSSKIFLRSLAGFVLVNILLYLFIYFFHNLIPFNSGSYSVDYHKFYLQPQAQGQPFQFLRSLSYSDAQWYLKIAEVGYPQDLRLNEHSDKTVYSSLAFAFFPLYPLVLLTANYVFGNIEFSAFTVSNIFLVLNFISLYFVVTKLFDKSLALKTTFLLFLFPFSIFYRLYFTEGLFLFLLVWFSFLFVKQKYLESSIFLGLMTVTRGNGFLLFFLFLFYLLKDLEEKNLKLEKFIYSIIFSLLPLGFWFLVNFLITGDPFFFSSIQKSWYSQDLLDNPFFHNLENLIRFPELELHAFHSSKIDQIMILLSLILLWRSKKFLGSKLWWISLILTLTPLLIKDSISISRYQSVIFPLFIYLAHILKGPFYYLTLVLFALGLFFAGILVVNWYWVG